MSKLYYTNPIVAAYMAEEFGVRFINRENQELSIGEIQRDCHPKMSENDIYYIHPDSLDIFEPKEGDLISINDGISAALITHKEFILALIANNDRFEAPLQIIRRNNKPFFVPEIEE